LRRASGALLTLLGAVSLYSVGRWGAIPSGPAFDDLLPVLGSPSVHTIAALLIGCLCLAAGMVFLGRGGVPIDAPAERVRWTRTQVVSLVHGIVVLGCLAILGLGASLGWSPRTLAAWAGVGCVEAALGLVLMPLYLRVQGPRSASLLSCGIILTGAAWAASIMALGFLGA
jgi:hypothetical protein